MALVLIKIIPSITRSLAPYMPSLQAYVQALDFGTILINRRRHLTAASFQPVPAASDNHYLCEFLVTFLNLQFCKVKVFLLSLIKVDK